jgi:hypothetical protein
MEARTCLAGLVLRDAGGLSLELTTRVVVSSPYVLLTTGHDGAMVNVCGYPLQHAE